MTPGLFDPAEPAGPSARGRMAITAAGVVVTAALLALVLGLGSWALEFRRFTLHHGRVQRLVEQHPSAARVTAGLLAEPRTWPIEAPGDPGALQSLAERCATGPAREVVSRRARWPRLRVFGVGEMIYFLYFDADDALVDFVVDTRRRGACEPGVP